MRKIICLLLSLTILCTVPSCKSESLKQLEQLYPDAKITGFGGHYTIISENIDLTAVDKEVAASTSEKDIYRTYEDLENSLRPDNALIFLGKKTGNSKQKIPVSEENVIDGIYFTESEVEVITPYYGDISAGDKIIYKEYYAVFTDENGVTALAHDEGDMPIDYDSYLFVVNTSSNSELYSGKRYVSMTGPYSPDKYYEYLVEDRVSESDKKTAEAGLIEKYIINKDTAVDREELTKKLQNEHSEITEEQTELINRLVAKYGEK